MKNIKLILTLFIGVLVFFGCEKDEIDRAALTDFPPGILSVSPADASKVVLGGFDIVVHFVDGSVSPLASATVKLSDAAGTELTSATKSLSGTADSLVIAGDSFNADSLEVGSYQITVNVTDSKGQSLDRTINFEITASLYAAVLDELYLAGGYNGWGADAFELVADNTWELKGVNLEGGAWKLKNCVSWCMDDWGDSDCNGVVELTTGGGPDTNCGYTGEVNFRFNDATLAYTLTPTVSLEGNLQSLYLHGNFNDFEGNQYTFNQTEDNTWVLNEIALVPGDRFRFSEQPFSMGKLYGASEEDGIAAEFGPNIVFGMDEAYYKVTFNDKTLAYSFEYVRDVPKIETLAIIGSATPNGWNDPDTDMSDEDGDGIYTLTAALMEGEIKFRANNEWAGLDWGGADFPSGVGVQGGGNIVVEPGFYNITFNSNTLEYSFEVATLGVIGSATPGGWDAETRMKHVGGGIYRMVLGLNDGEAKFRGNNDWPINWGSGDFPVGLGTQDGSNIPVSKGLYMISINALTGDYSFGPATVGIIGDATPGGWGEDTDMTVDADNPAILRGTFDLVDGEAKFRANNDWPINWGAGDFPSGVGTLDGSNIPVSAGTYNVTFNVNTGEYSFE
ncbi:MAG: SusF/SusE family outer membrane protein [Chitinophagales bacterium]